MRYCRELDRSGLAVSSKGIEKERNELAIRKDRELTLEFECEDVGELRGDSEWSSGRTTATCKGKRNGEKGITHPREIRGTSISTAPRFVVCLSEESKVERKEERKCGLQQP